MSDIFSEDDLIKAEHSPTLGPAYFAANRIAEQLMQGTESNPFEKVAAKCVDSIRQGVYDYIEDHIRLDLELNLGHYMRDMVERTVQALLTGEPWAMTQYAMSKFHDGEAVRKAVAKHGGEPLLMARIADLEAENKRLTENLAFYTR